MGQESGHGLVGCLWLKVSHEVAGVIEGSTGFEGRVVSKFTHMVIVRSHFLCMDLSAELPHNMAAVSSQRERALREKASNMEALAFCNLTLRVTFYCFCLVYSILSLRNGPLFISH